MSNDEGNKNFPVSQVLRRMRELGWYVAILDGEESKGWMNIQLMKDRSGFTLQIEDCGTKEDAKKTAAKGSWVPGIRFGTAIGRFYVGSPTDLDFNIFLPFFDFYCPDEKREKKETPPPPPPPPTMEIPQADQDRSQQLQKEFKEIKAKYDRGEISEQEYQSATMSRYYEMMGMFGKGWGRITEAVKQGSYGYVDPSMQIPDVSQAAEMMKQNRPIAGAPQFPGIPSAKGLGSEVPSGKIKCPSCGNVVDKKKFCTECGAALGAK
jgi:hypothetical protein